MAISNTDGSLAYDYVVSDPTSIETMGSAETGDLLSLDEVFVPTTNRRAAIEGIVAGGVLLAGDNGFDEGYVILANGIVLFAQIPQES